ncbi:MAG: glycoside hydrolase family 97 protein [Chitinophagaceae bacterium]|nr:glycoside hydrolase family 97 protein [Chitinophagaceae bacterium]
MIRIIAAFAFLLMASTSWAQKPKLFLLASPDNKIQVTVSVTEKITWAVEHEGQTMLAPSPMRLELAGGEHLGINPKLVSAKQQFINETISTVAYKKDVVENSCNQLTLTCKGNYGIIFRAYNDGVAYRFFTQRKEDIIVGSELAAFSFDKDYTAFIPHTSDLREGEKYSCSFEEFYTETPVSKFGTDTLGYLPLLIQFDKNKKAVLFEADVQDYPAMFVQRSKENALTLNATFAPYPLEEALGKRSKINYIPTKRADYIARTKGNRTFPWRVLAISVQDKDLLNNDMVQRLSEPNKIENTDWIKPGKVAWDWWNDWNISHVDFKAGINTPTYKYYIDFAAANKIEYVVLDEGWSDDWDLNKLSPAIDLAALLEYAKQKNVGLILWSTWYALAKDIEGLCAKYSAMGVRGFKVDFLDRNDQKMILSCYEMATIAAKHRLLLDFHGMFAPQGLQRTWPNVINFEGVRGMEYMKWSADDRVSRHAVSLPFIRMMAGPMDYTPGAFRNTTKGNAKPSNSFPQSLGTRCNQMAIYIIYEAPLQMLADNPTIYTKEQDCTDFIAKVPTTFNETVALDGKLGEYVVIARKKENDWFVGAMTNWNERDITIDFSFLKVGNYSVELYKDGLNAGKDATDYKRETIRISAADKLTIHLASGGGLAMRITKL